MDCLKGYIGMSKEVGEAASGLYLNELEGISMDSIERIADSDQRGAERVFDDIEKRALLKLRTFFTRELNICFKISRADIVECLICENKALLAVALWYLIGAECMREQINSERTNRFTTIDKSEAKDRYDDFMDDFFRELKTAVAGIDISQSPCMVDEEVVHNDFVEFRYGLP